MVRKDGNSIILEGNAPFSVKRSVTKSLFYQNMLDLQLLSLSLHCFHS